MGTKAGFVVGRPGTLHASRTAAGPPLWTVGYSSRSQACRGIPCGATLSTSTFAALRLLLRADGVVTQHPVTLRPTEIPEQGARGVAGCLLRSGEHVKCQALGGSPQAQG